PALPLSAYALAATRHMYLYGTTSEQLAEVAVAARQWAMRNPKALRRAPLTVDEVLASPLISSPLRGLDCCLVTDGGGAVVVTSAERARTLRRQPVYLLGSGIATTHEAITNMPELTETPARASGALAFARAGVRPHEVDVVEVYDSFTITVVLTLEALGFCRTGEGGAFVSGGRIPPDGRFPLNTSGGGDCGRPQSFPRPRCVRCGGSIAWLEASGEGRVYSYTVVHRAPHESLVPLVPYVVALVDLAEGVRMMSRVRAADSGVVQIGAAVRVAFERVSDEVTLPLFEVVGP